MSRGVGSNGGTRTRYVRSRWPSQRGLKSFQSWRRVHTSGPSVEVVEPGLLRELPSQRVLVRLARLDPASRRRPQLLPAREDVARQQDAVVGVEHDPAHGLRAPGACRAMPSATRTSAAAPRTARRRWPATSTAGRRARCRRATASAAPAPAARRTRPGTPPCPRTRSPAAAARPRARGGALPSRRSRRAAGRPTPASCGRPRSWRRTGARAARTAPAGRTDAA